MMNGLSSDGVSRSAHIVEVDAATFADYAKGDGHLLFAHDVGGVRLGDVVVVRARGAELRFTVRHILPAYEVRQPAALCLEKFDNLGV